MQPEPTSSLRDPWLTRLQLICKPPVVRKALLAAGVVGTCGPQKQDLHAFS